jgi:hypothetical protein
MWSRDSFENFYTAYFKLPGTTQISTSAKSHYSCLWMGTVIVSAQDFFLLQFIQTNYVSHPALYSKDIRGFFPCGKVAGEYSWLELHLVLRLRMELYCHFCIFLHGMHSHNFTNAAHRCEIPILFQHMEMPERKTWLCRESSHNFSDVQTIA